MRGVAQSDIKIMRAKVADAQAIRALETLVWKEEVTNKYDIPMFVRFGYVFVAKAKGKIIGAIISIKTNKNDIYVSDVVVHPSYRGQKIGEKLYRKLLRTVTGSDIVSFLNPKLTPTVNLHMKLGAKIISKIVNPYGLERGIEAGVRLFVRIKNNSKEKV